MIGSFELTKIKPKRLSFAKLIFVYKNCKQ